VEKYLESSFYLTCYSEFKNAFPDPTVTNKSIASGLVNRFHDTGTIHRAASKMSKDVNASTAEGDGYFRQLISRFIFIFK
jgi:hypothetical protein